MSILANQLFNLTIQKAIGLIFVYDEEYDSYGIGKSPLHESAGETYSILQQQIINTPTI